MNELDSELVQGALAAAGHELVPTVEDADVVLINTCSVRDLAEHKVWSQLGRLAVRKKTDRPGLVIGVLGCMAEREGRAILERAPQVDILCGPSRLDRVPDLVARALGERRATPILVTGHTTPRPAGAQPEADSLEALDLSRALSPGGTKAQAYVRISRGCNKMCSFCVVPFARGPEVHRPPENIVGEVRRLADAGVLEVTLLGQTVNHYAYADGGRTTSFAELLWRVHEAVPNLPRLRFVSSYPRDFDDETLDVMGRCDRICRFLHLPVQSGSNRILRLMNRGHSVEEYIDLIARARARMPDLRVATDFIAGFPTETEADHQASVALVKSIRFKNAFVFKYSARPGTAAARRFADDVPDETKRERNRELLDLQTDICFENHQALAGQRLEVLVEGTSKLGGQGAEERVQPGWEKRREASEPVKLIGRTRGDEIVAFQGPRSLVGQIVTVRAVGATPLTVVAELGEAYG